MVDAQAAQLAVQLGAVFPELYPHITDLTGGPEMSRSPLTASTRITEVWLSTPARVRQR